jgi:hypothetical protein
VWPADRHWLGVRSKVGSPENASTFKNRAIHSSGLGNRPFVRLDDPRLAIGTRVLIEALSVEISASVHYIFSPDDVRHLSQRHDAGSSLFHHLVAGNEQGYRQASPKDNDPRARNP